MKKRILAALLSVAMIAAVVSSCGDKANSSSDSASGSQTVSENNAGGEEGSDRVTEITLPICEDKMSFTEWRSWSNDYISNYGEVKCIIELENRTNVHVDYTCVPASAGVEKFGLMLASGEYADMIEATSAQFNYPGGPDTAVADGVFWDMTDAVYNYMPNYFKLLNDYPDAKQIAITDEGRNVGIYMIRCWTDGANQQVVVEAEPAWCGISVRQDWLDELNMDVPRTIDQLHDVLVAFRDNYGAWMHLYTDGTIGSDYILSAYGVTQDFYLGADGKTVGFGPVTDAYKSYCELMRDWYAEDLIDPNFTATDSTAILTAHTYYANNNCGVGMTYQGTCGNYHYVNGYTEKEDIYLTPIQGPVLKEGDTTVTTFQSEVATVPQWITTSVTEEEMPYLAQWLDYHYTFEYDVLAGYGPEGESHTVDPSSEWYYVFTDAVKHPTTAGMTPTAARQLHVAFNNVGYMDWKSGWQLWELVGNDWSQNAYETWGKQTDDIMLPPSASFTTEESNEYTSLFADIEAYVAENTVKFINGTLDIDSNWDNYVSTLENMNYQRCVELKQASVDRYFGKVWALEGKD